MSTNACHSQLTLTSEPEKFRNPPWWNRRTKLERTLCFVTVTSLFVFFVMVTALAIFGYLYQKNQDSGQFISPGIERFFSPKSYASKHCLTAGCVKAAAGIMYSLDESVDPCEDMYRFACGGWIERHEIPDDKSSVDVYDTAQDDLDLKLKGLLEKKSDETQPPYVKMMKDLYNTCMDTKSIEKAGSEPLKRVLRLLGGWPVVEGRRWDESGFDWVDTLISLRNLGFDESMLLNLYVYPDPRNNTRHIILVDQTSLGMPSREYYLSGLNDTTTAAYFAQMVKAAKLLGAKEKNAERELMKALEFETTLANYSWPPEERRNHSKLYNKYTVRELQELVPLVPWMKFFNGLLIDEIYENDTLIVSVPDFVAKFAGFISSTEKRVVANYMMWRVVDRSLSFLSKEWRDISQEYDSVVSGESEEEARWKQCQGAVDNYLGVALSAYYIKNHFKEDSKNAAQTLVKYIHKAFLNILDEIDWMDEKTRAAAKEKANTMRSFIGYSQELLNDTAVTEIYENLTITSEGYFETILTLRKWTADDHLSKLRKPPIKGDWKENGARVAMVNAFANKYENNIEIPAGILQNPFFNKDRPHYLNFGSIGSIIGHEITHGFDDSGRQFDKDGNNVNWWEDATDERFKRKAQCVIDQYGNYTAENGMKLNGINTLGENIADIGGLKEAYWAYQSWIQDNGPELQLPGLKYTQNQLFWISGAVTECAKHRPEELKLRIISGAHSPAQFRIIGPMSNIPEFAKDFNCPPGSPMNKENKCQVW